MKNLFRHTIAFIIVSPLIIFVYLAMPIIGKKKAIRLCGPLGTYIAMQSLRFFAPTLEKNEDFDIFPSKMKNNFWLWKPFYDFEITEENKDIFKLYVSNCPFCEVLNKCHLSDLGPYICQGDWEYAKSHKDQWLFKREHQIGTGDNFCDHTYIRKKGNKKI